MNDLVACLVGWIVGGYSYSNPPRLQRGVDGQLFVTIKPILEHTKPI